MNHVSTSTGDHVNTSSVLDPPTLDSFLGQSSATTSVKSNQDFIEALIGVSLKTLKDVDDFTKDLDAGKFPVWAELESDIRSMATDAIYGFWEAFMAVENAKSNTLIAEPVLEGVNISIPRKVVEKVSSRLEHTLYGYFIGKKANDH